MAQFPASKSNTKPCKALRKPQKTTFIAFSKTPNLNSNPSFRTLGFFPCCGRPARTCFQPFFPDSWLLPRAAGGQPAPPSNPSFRTFFPCCGLPARTSFQPHHQKQRCAQAQVLQELGLQGVAPFLVSSLGPYLGS